VSSQGKINVKQEVVSTLIFWWVARGGLGMNQSVHTAYSNFLEHSWRGENCSESANSSYICVSARSC
jgi:hypothetical protein